jgi:hypothetical protein
MMIFKVINTKPNKNFCRHQCQQQNLFQIVLASLLIIFSSSIFVSALADDEDQVLNQTKLDFKDSQAKPQETQEPNVLKKPVLVGEYNTDGKARGVTVVGRYAYIADYEKGLKIINIVNPTNPVLAGSLDTDGLAVGVTVVDDYAYVADNDKGLKIINISTPANPSLVGGLSTHAATGVMVIGDYAYIADYSYGLKIINISTPANPSLVGSLATDGNAMEVIVTRDDAYVVDNDKGLKIINIVNPTNPVLVGSLDTDGGANGVAVVGGYAYVADGHRGLKIINITTPSEPDLVGDLDFEYAIGVTILGDYAYVANGGGLKIINVATPAVPVLLGGLDTDGSAYVVVVEGNYAYVADWDKGLKIIRVKDHAPVVSDLYKSTITDSTITFTAKDFTDKYSDLDEDPLTKIQITSLPNPNEGTLKLAGAPVSIDQEIDVKYLDRLTFEQAENWTGNISFSWKGNDRFEYSVDPAKVNISVVAKVFPEIIGSTAEGGEIERVVISGEYAYATDKREGLKVISLSSKSNPRVVGNSPNKGESYGVAVLGDYAYVAALDEGLRIIKISRPSSPYEVGHCDTDGYAVAVSVVDEQPHLYAYVVVQYKGLRIVDITNYKKPYLVGSLDTDGEAVGISISADRKYAYLADSKEGLKIIDIVNKSTPSLIGSIKTDGNVSDVAVSGNYAYIADYDRGLKVIDISTPESPALVSSLAIEGRAIGIKIVGGYAYIADDTGGMKIIDVEMPQAPIQIGEKSTSGKSSGVTASSNYAYLADGKDGFKVIQMQSNIPTVSAVFKSGRENESVGFVDEDFEESFHDKDGDRLKKIKFSTLSTNGDLKLEGKEVQVNQEIDAGNLNALIFEPVEDWCGVTSFRWRGSDRFVYSEEPADVRITLAKQHGHSTEESSGLGEKKKQHFCDEYWWSCYVIPPIVAAGCAITTATVSATIYLHKKGMWCFRKKEYLPIN